MANSLVSNVLGMNPLKDGEEYVGGFLGRSRALGLRSLILGPLAMRQYQIVLTNQRILVSSVSIFRAVGEPNSYPLNEISRVEFKSGLIGPMVCQVFIDFKNGDKLKLDSNTVVLGNSEGIVVNDKIKSFLKAQA